MVSGYRDKDKKTVTFTTRYTEAYDKIEEEVRSRVISEAAHDPELTEDEIEAWIHDELDTELNDFRLVILLREVESASIFKTDVYEKYFRVDNQANQENNVPSRLSGTATQD